MDLYLFITCLSIVLCSESVKKAAPHNVVTSTEKIKKNSDILVVIGIGGSYLGARAAIEFVKSNNYNLVKKDTPDIYFGGNTISSSAVAELIKLIEGKDFYMAAADFESYMDIQRKAQELFRDKETWNRMALMNVAGSPAFFVDRTVQEYCDRIWNM